MSFEEQIQNATKVLLFLDFDGTLAPIVPRPADAEMPRETLASIQSLAANPKYRIAFVSGRSAEDLRQRAPVTGAIYAGNHGLEIFGAGLQFSFSEEPLLRHAVKQLRAALIGIEGVELEDKGLSASVHFRRVPEREWPRVEEAVMSTVPAGLNIRGGKMVFEIRPTAEWNKGSAVRWIAEQLQWGNGCQAYLGDDLTDEDAFAAMPKDSLTVYVGRSESTMARYRLRDTVEVGELLRRLAQ